MEISFVEMAKPFIIAISAFLNTGKAPACSVNIVSKTPLFCILFFTNLTSAIKFLLLK